MAQNIDYVITGKYKQELGKKAQEIMFKLNAVEDNMDFILEELGREFTNDSLYQKYRTISSSDIKQIVIDTDDYDDEFYLDLKNTDDSIIIEVETRVQAMNNDLDFVNLNNGYTQEELDTYRVGGTLSSYTQLPNTDIFFRFM